MLRSQIGWLQWYLIATSIPRALEELIASRTWSLTWLPELMFEVVGVCHPCSASTRLVGGLSHLSCQICCRKGLGSTILWGSDVTSPVSMIQPLNHHQRLIMPRWLDGVKQKKLKSSSPCLHKGYQCVSVMHKGYTQGTRHKLSSHKGCYSPLFMQRHVSPSPTWDLHTG